jgi:hypothetical protein
MEIFIEYMPMVGNSTASDAPPAEDTAQDSGL